MGERRTTQGTVRLVRSRLAGLLLTFSIGLFPAIAFCASPTAEKEIGQQIRARLDAYERGDAKQWAAFVDDDCLCAGESKADIVRAITNRPPAVRNGYGDVRELQARVHGDVAVVRYRIAEFTEVSGQRNSLEQRRTETYVRRAGRWVLIAAAENVILPDPEPVPVSREILARYVGKYQYTPGSFDTITLEDGRLFVQSSGEPKVEIFAENPTTFFAKGQEWRLVFRTDSQGAVTSLAFRQQGQEYVALPVH